MRIIIVEDEIKIREGMGKLIESLTDHIVLGEASDGEEGLDLVLRFKPDLVITDIRMPKMDGLEMIRRLYEQKIPVHAVILSGYSEFEYAKKAIQYGVDDYLLKPLAVDDVQDRIFHKRLDEKLVNPDIFCLFTYIYLTDKSIVEPHFLKADIFFQPVCHLRDGHHLVAFIYAVPENDPQVAQHFANLIFLLFNRHPVDGIQRIVQKMWIDLSLQRPYLRVFLLLCDLSYFCDQILNFSCHGIEIVRDLSHLILSIHMHLNIQITALHLLDSPYNTPCGPLYKANRITYE